MGESPIFRIEEIQLKPSQDDKPRENKRNERKQDVQQRETEYESKGEGKKSSIKCYKCVIALESSGMPVGSIPFLARIW